MRRGGGEEQEREVRLHSGRARVRVEPDHHSFRPEAAQQALDLGNSPLDRLRAHSPVGRQVEAVVPGRGTGPDSGRRNNLPGRANRPALVLDRRSHRHHLIGVRKARAHSGESTAAAARSRSAIVAQRAEAAVVAGVAVAGEEEEEEGDEKLEP